MNQSRSGATCGFVPYPGSGAYGHWECERPRHHFGRHRFINYTVPRVPRIWRLKHLGRAVGADRRLRAMTKDKPGGPSGYGYRQILFPAKYEPVR